VVVRRRSARAPSRGWPAFVCFQADSLAVIFFLLCCEGHGCGQASVDHTHSRDGGPRGVYLISDKPMTEEAWREAFVKEG
ncbi:MAG: hypothetical protein WBW73_06855, partial [Rhodoplanes sp.]